MHEEIRKAETLPSEVYTSPEVFAAAQERIFWRTWSFAADTSVISVPGQVYPFTLLPGCLDEPILLTRDAEDRIHCLSNVCTHRGHLVQADPGHERSLRCRYHGRRFGLDGKFQSMPEFQGVCGFPTERDDLPSIPFALWEHLVFVSPAPAFSFQQQTAPVRDRLAHLPLSEARFDASRSREYLVRANWALYVENYLDALHIPFVHGELSGALDYEDYPTLNFPYGNLQIGVTKDGEDAFDAPPGSPDAGRRVAAYYLWLFPATMLNFYTWGVSINVVRPVAVDATKVAFLRYAWDADRTGSRVSDDGAVDRVEREDEAVVEAVQRGARSRFYRSGRYSPTREQGTHHFHRLLAELLNTQS